MKGFRLLEQWEVDKIEAEADAPETRAYWKRVEANARCHCLCGRFTKPPRYRLDDLIVDCSRCGTVIL